MSELAAPAVAVPASDSSEVSLVADELLVSRAVHPSIGSCLSVAVAAMGGSLVLLPGLLLVGYFVSWLLAALVWSIWLILGGIATLPWPSNILARTLEMRPPTPDELDVLRPALIRVCVAAGADPEAFTVRIADGESNAYSAGRDIVAVTADFIGGPTPLEETELEALIAHEVGHHRHGDLVLGGARWWYISPLRLVDRLQRVLHLVPIVGGMLASPLALLLRVIVVPVVVLDRASRSGREFLADRFAADCGYATPLARVFAYLARHEPTAARRVVEIVTASHPPLADRIARLQDVASDEVETAVVREALRG